MQRTDDDAIALIRKLLLKGWAVLEVRDYVRKQRPEWAKLGRNPIDTEAKILESHGKIERVRKVRAGMAKPGRKPGQTDTKPRKERSDSSRDKIIELAAKGKTRKQMREILGLSRTAVDRHLAALGLLDVE